MRTAMIVIMTLGLLFSCACNGYLTAAQDDLGISPGIIVEYYVDDVSKPIDKPAEKRAIIGEIIEDMKVSPYIWSFDELSLIRIYEFSDRNHIYIIAGNEQGGWPYCYLFSYDGKVLKSLKEKAEIHFAKPEGADSVLVEVYDWSNIGNGSMDLYELTDNRLVLILPGASIVDFHHENMEYAALKNSLFKDLSLSERDKLSFVIKGGRLSVRYEDVNGDGHFDVISEGKYECYLSGSDGSRLISSEDVRLVFLYQPDTKEFSFREEESIVPESWKLTRTTSPGSIINEPAYQMSQ